MKEDIFKSISALEAAFILGAINTLTELVKRGFKWIKETREKRKYSIDNTSIIHERVKNAEHKLMSGYRNFRGMIFHFWNGDKTYADLSLVKIAIRHEITLYDELPYITEHYQGRPTPEMFYAGIRKTFKDGHCIITKDDTEKNPPLKEFFDTWGMGSMLWVRINDKNEEPAAIMVMAWQGAFPYHDNNDILTIKRKKRVIEDIYAGRPIPEDYLKLK